jgi:hypothetical protein
MATHSYWGFTCHITATEGKQFTVEWGDGSDPQIYTGTGVLMELDYKYPNNNNNNKIITITGNSNDCAITDLSCFTIPYTLDVSGCISIKSIDCLDYCGDVKKLNVKNCKNLETLFCAFNPITNLELSDCISLKSLFCDECNLSSLVLPPEAVLHDVWCANNHIPLSDLYTISLQTINPYYNYYRAQTLPPQTINLGESVDFSSQSSFGGTPTDFIVYKGDTNAPQSDYTIENGIITFYQPGSYKVMMTNDAIICNDGVFVYTYVYVIDSDATLKELKISSGFYLNLFPVFKSNIYHYEVDAQPDMSSVYIAAISTSLYATIKGCGSFPLIVGENIFKITVTAEDKITKLDYTIKVNRPVGIIENPQTTKLIVYPNPTTGELRITNYKLRITNVEIFDIYGKKLKAKSRKQKEKNEIVIDISELPAGIYFVKIDTDVGEVIKKIVKQ